MLTVNELSIFHAKTALVKSISFQIEKGEWLALVGQSGSGKSVTSAAIGQLLPPNLHAAGEILYENQNLVTLRASGMRRLRGKRLSYVFQDYQGSFTPFLTIGQHFEEYQRTHLRLSRSARKEQAEQALVSVGLKKEIYIRYPFQLSGGQLQRISIALALLLKPDILIADEPTTALDSISSFKVLELLARLQKETGCAILFITHDLRHAVKYADRVAVMKEGEIVEEGGMQQVLHHPAHPYTKQLIEASPFLNRPLNFSAEEVLG
ncbi:MAG TPA: ABC transporter ATP-binding protein [Planococcus sp. (in: firmicutes)]|nr:ABC transporter ATP-binding protein [Planococcus sp. (in: firmicutes)]